MRGSDPHSLPSLLGDMAPLGGSIKSCPEDFLVEELPGFEPSGLGDHIFVTLRRRGMNTAEVETLLQDVLGLDRRDVGCAGRKDKVAVATQCFSLQHKGNDDELRAALETIEGLDLIAMVRNERKLRPGQLRGNRFGIRIRGANSSAFSMAKERFLAMAGRGFVNYFGAQRFGSDGRNAERAQFGPRQRRRMSKSKARLFLSAWQSALFNEWLALRIEDGLIDELIEGDIAKTSRGGLFIVEDAEEANTRFKAGELRLTGPLFGAKTMRATGAAGERESQLLAKNEIDEDTLLRLDAPGTRRPAIVCPEELEWKELDEDVELFFSLPSGSYATVLLAALGTTELSPRSR